MKFLNAGCGTHYAPGWVNCDVWESDTTKPDVKVSPGKPYPFEDNTFDAVYLGHVLEHIDWSGVGDFLDDMSRIAKPGAPILIVGPDVFTTIKRWASGQEPWEMILSTMEHQDYNWQPEGPIAHWDGATHHWNCHYERVAQILQHHRMTPVINYTDVIPNDVTMTSWHDHETDIVWPVVAKWHWQFAILVYNPTL